MVQEGLERDEKRVWMVYKGRGRGGGRGKRMKG